ncbi:MAG TPA: hypothetical protein DCY20_01740 [Firmicutes bacterium]|nr:hypothetical protein [Bacillota bacterium]
MKRDLITLMVSLCVIIVGVIAVMQSNLKEISINDNGELNTFTTYQQTVEDFLKEQKIRVGNFDEMNVDFTDGLTDGMEIEITRAQAVVINDGGVKTRLMTTETTVADVLEQRSIALSSNDELSVEQTTSVEGDMEIEITRVDKQSESVFEEVELDVNYVYTDDVPRNEQNVLYEGRPQVIEHVMEKVYKNGEVVETYEVETKIVDEGQARTIQIGTGPISTFTANMTAYDINCTGCGTQVACKPYTDVSNTIYYSDSEYSTVRIVAAGSDIPCGTIVEIDGIGKAIVLDRGSAVTGNDLDLLVNTNPWDFGRKYKTTKVLRWGW